ncbi:MAG: alkaline phosphatase D family protein [Saprospiraceae bacterium]
MNKIAYLLCLCATFFYAGSSAQQHRSMPDSSLAPFYHGVASGDPLTDRVILWTRITLEDPIPELQAQWRIATDTAFANVVNSGVATTSFDRDYTLKVDADGLQPDTWYYYQFEYQGVKSLTGRTRTLPAGSLDRLRLGVVSCADYQNGYYHAYRDLAMRNTVDMVIHLGDYIYEYPAASGLPDRNHEPPYEIITVADYRLRHSLYKLDADLRLLHQQLPMIAVWDDHETANNSWTDGAQNHQPNEGEWSDRKKAGKQAYIEWMPIRENVVADDEIYRKFNFGNLLSLYMLDTRLEGRNEQVSATNPAINAPDRTIISEAQFAWLTECLQTDSARWIVIGQQVMMAPLLAFGQALNTDQWDGYPAQRQRLYDFFQQNGNDNVVVLTGDIHTAWANDLPLPGYAPATGANSAGVEFVATSISSAKFSVPGGPAIVQSLNPHVKFVELTRYGYYILDLDPQRAQADYVFVNDVKQPTYAVETGPSWATLHGSRRLTPATLAPAPAYPPLAPFAPQGSVAVWEASKAVSLAVAPNPFFDQMVLQFALHHAQPVSVLITDMQGRTIMRKDFAKMAAGIQHVHFDASALASGVYVVSLLGESGAASSRILKR